jgi:hypothetical protein
MSIILIRNEGEEKKRTKSTNICFGLKFYISRKLNKKQEISFKQIKFLNKIK